MKKLVFLFVLSFILLFVSCDQGNIINGGKPPAEETGIIRISLPSSKSVDPVTIREKANNFKIYAYNADETYTATLTDTASTAELYVVAGTYKILCLAEYNYLMLATGYVEDIVVYENMVTDVTLTLKYVTYEVSHNIPAQMSCSTEYLIEVTPTIDTRTPVVKVDQLNSTFGLLSDGDADGIYSVSYTAPSQPTTQDLIFYQYVFAFDDEYSKYLIPRGANHDYIHQSYLNTSLGDEQFPASVEIIAGSTPTGIEINIEWE
ncbi:MAG: hypothetical protein JW969_20120 [Spirochaetales bacterium]|nr:hypothetical protein [Spirochaetales bacterium]